MSSNQEEIPYVLGHTVSELSEFPGSEVQVIRDQGHFILLGSGCTITRLVSRGRKWFDPRRPIKTLYFSEAPEHLGITTPIPTKIIQDITGSLAI